MRGQYVGRLDLWLPAGAIVPGGLNESGLVLARTEINVYPGKKHLYVLRAFVPNAVHDGKYSLTFIPQSTLDPQLMKVTFSAPAWSTSGPDSVLWVASDPTTFVWHLSH